MPSLEERGYERVWSDEPCDRTEGHRGLNDIFCERYLLNFQQWVAGAHTEDQGDAVTYSGSVLGKPIVVVRACDGDTLYELHPMGAQCIVLNCTNRKKEGQFFGDICGPCHRFITTGEGRHSQAHRNAVAIAERLLKKALSELRP